VAAFAVFIAFQPSDFRVARSTTIAAPPAQVFAHVNDLHKWEAWSPWAKLDPNAKVGFEGPAAGEGAAMTWSGNQAVGAGRMTIKESKPDERIGIDVVFTEPFAGDTLSQFNFAPDGNGTKVTWTMKAQHGYLEKLMCFVFNGTKMVGDDLDKGLAQLKSVSEAS
jgi:carbon monoxide dehydrogenase subunit G